MHDTDFDNFLDSDDDAIFVEASNHLFDYDLTLPEATQTTEKNVPQNEPKSVTSCHFKLQNSFLVDTVNITPDSGKIFSNAYENTVKNILTVATTSTKSNSCTVPSLNKKTLPDNSYINSRFTPGFTPKAKKRKLPGPAGLLELFESKEAEPGSPQKMLAIDMEFEENIVSSQFTPEHLSLSSWQKLQTAVSSCSNLHSTAKYYSIQRVLLESSKKKLPKHMIVPVLCVLLKKVTCKGSTTISVFMDDTGEINGKIDAEVFSTFKAYMIEGAAFILKKVTFLCNVLILKAENLVSIYQPDGTEKHPQSLESILETSEPMKPMKCECPKLSHHSIKSSTHKVSNNVNTPGNNKSACINPNPKRLNHISLNQNKTVNKNISNLNSKPSSSTTLVKSMRSDAFLEDLLDENNCMDDFDELLGNLDEKSFMGDM